MRIPGRAFETMTNASTMRDPEDNFFYFMQRPIALSHSIPF